MSVHHKVIRQICVMYANDSWLSKVWVSGDTHFYQVVEQCFKSKPLYNLKNNNQVLFKNIPARENQQRRSSLLGFNKPVATANSPMLNLTYHGCYVKRTSMKKKYNSHSPVQPLRFSLLTSAPCCSRTLAQSRWPSVTARWRGVRPRGSTDSKSVWGKKKKKREGKQIQREIKVMWHHIRIYLE